MKTKITYVYYSKKFAERDFNLLKDDYQIKMVYFAPRTMTNVKLFLQYFYSSLKSVRNSAVVVFMMGGSHIWIPMLISKIFRKKSIIVLGGADSQNLPYISYGMFYKKGLKTRINALMYKWSNLLLPVDESLISSVNKYNLEGKSYKVGVRAFIEDIEDKFRVVPTEYDATFWRNFELEREGVFAVTSLNNHETFILKGYDLLFELAKKMNHVQFTLAGVHDGFRKTLTEVPSNLTLLGLKTEEELLALYNNHSVYLLPSLSEGLPNVLCESMLCGCIPVVSNVGGNKKAVGENGFVLERPNLNEWEAEVKKALKSSNLDRSKNRERIIHLFKKGTRKKGLLYAINSLID